MTNNPMPTIPLWQRQASSIANLFVRLWPGESKHWGQAFAAELSEIETPIEAFRWLLGGLMLLTRERFKSFLRSFGRPVGVPAGGNLELLARQSRQVPRTPRLVTAFFLLASLAILLHPEVRTALHSIARSYVNPDEDTSRWSSVHQLRKEAESTRDPKLFALLALLSTDDSERLRLTDQAIALDPSFTWLDYENAAHSAPASGHINEKRIARLINWDPQNAAVLVLPAETVFDNYISRDNFKADGDNIVNSPHASEWLAAMNRVYAAPRYDNYSARVDQLIRDVSATHPRLDPDIAACILPKEKIPELWNFRVYAQWLIAQGKQAEQRGDLATASNDYGTAVRFAAMLHQPNTFTIERLIGAAIGKNAAPHLQPLLEKTDPRQAEMLAFPLADWSRIEGSPWRDLWESFEWSGLSLQIAATSTFVLAILSAFSLLVSAVSARRSSENPHALHAIASWIVDACPPLLLLSNAALYFLYHPFAQTYSRYLRTPAIPPLREQLEAALFVSHMPWLNQFFGTSEFTFRFWLALTAILSLAALALLTRLLRRHHQPAQPS